MYEQVKIRITAAPRERELDGVPLDCFRPGTVCYVSASVASWLIAQGYASVEMRQASRTGANDEADALSELEHHRLPPRERS